MVHLKFLLDAVKPTHNAVATQEKTREQSTSVHDDHETAEANAQEEVAGLSAHTFAPRVRNLRKVRVLSMNGLPNTMC